MRTGEERAATDTPGDMKGNGMYYNECPQCGLAWIQANIATVKRRDSDRHSVSCR